MPEAPRALTEAEVPATIEAMRPVDSIRNESTVMKFGRAS